MKRYINRVFIYYNTFEYPFPYITVLCPKIKNDLFVNEMLYISRLNLNH